MSIGFRKNCGRKRLLGRIAALLAIGAIIGAVMLWRAWIAWTPDRQTFPVQGVMVSSLDGAIDWHSVAKQGADFAYIRATASQGRRDVDFARNWTEARRAGLRYGALIAFDPCRRAAEQATLYVTTVPRDSAALPPAVDLDFRPQCQREPSRDRLLSEINTMLNLIETHSGKPAILRLSKRFERQYALSNALNRTLWLRRNLFEPDYATRPWVLWSAADRHRMNGVEEPVDWVVVGK